MRSLVFDKTGIRVDVDDPIFALVALNEAVLEEATARHVALLDAATEKLAQALAASGTVHGIRPGTTPGPMHEPMHQPMHEPAPASSGLREARLIALGISLAILAAMLVLAGQILFFKPQPESMIEVPRLTPGQAIALKNAEKLGLAVQRLDQKTRDLIQAELEKQ